MIIYVLNIIITVALSAFSIKLEKSTSKKWMVWLARFGVILIPSILAGLRYGTGTDHLKVYQPIFENAKLGIYINRGREVESGYMLLNKLVILFNGNFSMLMFLASFITNTFFVLGIYNYKEKINVPFAIGIYLLMYYQLSFNAVRQMMAQSIIFFGFKFLNYDKGNKNAVIGILKYSICVIIACLFHKTALIMFSVILINLMLEQKKVKHLKFIVYAMILLLVVNCNYISLIMRKIPFLSYYAHYLKSPENIEISIWYFVKVIPIILPYIFVKKEIDKDKDYNLLFSLTVIGSILNLLGFFTVEYGERISVYFIMAQIAIVPAYIEILKKSDKKILNVDSKKCFVIVSILFTIFYTSYWYHDYCYKKMHQTVPYKSIFQQNN